MSAAIDHSACGEMQAVGTVLTGVQQRDQHGYRREYYAMVLRDSAGHDFYLNDDASTTFVGHVDEANFIEPARR